MATWRVMINNKLWDQKQYEQLWKELPETRMLAQSKGNAKMTRVPKQGDKVLFVLGCRVVMRGEVRSDGFLVGDSHRNHSCNKGDSGARKHTVCNEFAWVHVTEICEHPETYIFDGQRTWRCLP